MVPQIVSILMVDDDSLDVESFRRALSKNKIINPFYHAVDGIEALDIIRGTHPDKHISKPYLVLMDINMPRMNGIECLKELRKDPETHDAVVFIMTTSSDERDLYEAYDLNVAGYMVKSDLGSNFIRSIEMLDKYFNAIVLPPA